MKTCGRSVSNSSALMLLTAYRAITFVPGAIVYRGQDPYPAPSHVDNGAGTR
jgi:hypothetical protein